MSVCAVLDLQEAVRPSGLFHYKDEQLLPLAHQGLTPTSAAPVLLRESWETCLIIITHYLQHSNIDRTPKNKCGVQSLSTPPQDKCYCPVTCPDTAQDLG